MDQLSNNSMSDFVKVSLSKIKEMVDVNTIVGEPIEGPDGMTLIPVSKVSFGFGTAGADSAKNRNSLSAANGAGVKIEPICFLVIKNGVVRTLGIQPPPSGAFERIVDMVPVIMDKVDERKGKSKEK